MMGEKKKENAWSATPKRGEGSACEISQGRDMPLKKHPKKKKRKEKRGPPSAYNV